MPPEMDLVVLLIVCLLVALSDSNWCDLDTGYTTIVDGHGNPRSVYISVTRDGSIWLRAGQDHKSFDWLYENELRYHLQTSIIPREDIDMLASINYTDTCVLTDISLHLSMDSGWHPSYLVMFDPRVKESKVVLFRHSKDCQMNTTLTFADNKQGLYCNGGRRHVCGLRNLPEKGHSSRTLFLKHVNLEPQGQEHLICPGKDTINDYTFVGSYYHAYVKLASCPKPSDSRILGHEAKLRAHRDTFSNTVLIPDPTQMALHNGVIKGWQAFAKIISIQHDVYLQVWRPREDDLDEFTLVGQSYFHPSELRFQEVIISESEYLHVRKGDVLGLYFPKQNPIAWSSVPCAYEQQRYKFLHNPAGMYLGQSHRFHTADAGPTACRQYSFTAVLANKTDSKLIEDWVCPTAEPPYELRKRSDASSRTNRKDVLNTATHQTPGFKMLERRYSSGNNVPVHLVLIIIGCLLLLLIIIGFVSYYKAIRS